MLSEDPKALSQALTDAPTKCTLHLASSTNLAFCFCWVLLLPIVLWLKSSWDCSSQSWCLARSSRNAQIPLPGRSPVSEMHKDIDKKEINRNLVLGLSEKPALHFDVTG